MARDRIVVGAFGDDTDARQTARRLRDAGHEVVFVGGHQSVDQLLRTAIAEDASRIVVDGDDDALDRLRGRCAGLGTDAPEVGADV